ncbi:phytanoyl-CoA dioxygenase family protein [Aliarcobacter skirrowii]|uniref:phytanoyl-CoA dioxygenase family protein n=1 Tax=Aliarcobacter skirrowii TaxID=28200 RepID=UPI0029A7A116|nr:phytanoyl-CoA dioxygenase family protein [Aliarcobacter skirrowii]MDX4065645.1 phytanoyl-CoA dioxygenase family protein [Aliarcobacter skirrowii]
MNFDNIKKQYLEEGGIVIKGLLKDKMINDLETEYLSIVNEITGKDFDSWHDKDLLQLLQNNQAVEANVYDRCRDTMSSLVTYSMSNKITDIVKHLIGNNSSCFNRRIMRIDLPLETKELAHWHQDYYYVKGNTDVIIVWIALHDITWFNGCLSYMPKTHKLGIIEHDVPIGKKHVPSAIFDKEVRYLEMKKGDVLFFNTLLLHSSNMNYSDKIRYSLQFRYTPNELPIDPYMLGTTQI